MVRTLAVAALLAAFFPIHADEVLLATCDRLPVVEARISGMKFLFLVDTAAVSTLNLKSFAHGDATRAEVSSWSGTVEAKAQSVVIGDFAIGQHHIKDLRLLAVDLSPIGIACGQRIDGILGIDLLARLGATVDLKSHPARLLLNSGTMAARIAELQTQLAACQQAFNRADEPAFAGCLTPDVVVFTVGGDFYGRDAAMAYYRTRYFQHNPPAQVTLTPRAFHPIGDAIWVEYDLRLTLGEQVIQVRGTAVCQEFGGRWRIVHMNHSSPLTDFGNPQAQAKH